MNYNEIDVDEVLESIDTAIDQGNYRKATTRESLEVRLAAISEIVHNMQMEVKAENVRNKEFVHV